MSRQSSSFRKTISSWLIVSVAVSLFLVSDNASAATIKVVTPPSIAEVATVGTKLQVKVAKFNLKTTKVAWQWFYNGKAISKATTNTYTIKSTQKTGTLKAVETAYFGASKKTVSSNVINVGIMKVTGQASLNFLDGQKTAVAANLPTVLPKNASAEIVWLRDNFDILSDGRATRTVAVADRGSTLAAKITFKAKGYKDVTVYSNDVNIDAKARTYRQVWSAEFNGKSGADAGSDWSAENGDGVAYGNRGWGNSERQWYRWENAAQDGSGTLNITATREGASNTHCYYGACEWYSSKIVTKGKVGFLYGRLEARIKGAPGNGTWGAFWTLGADIDTKLWPWCGEIDVTELVGSMPNSVLGYSHGPVTYGGGRGNTTILEEDWSKQYHTYAIDWLPDQLIWYVDGQVYGVVNKTDRDWVYDHEFYVILNLAMGGNLGGNIDPNQNSSVMKVDWVRFSQIDGVGQLIRH
jgi:beta-glucanase (GH16 family)